MTKKEVLNKKDEGLKFDGDKNRLDLLPLDAIEEIGKVLTVGAKKYDDRNWEKGMTWSRLLGACMRHLFAFWRGNDYDDETSLLHLSHAGCCILFLLTYQLRKIGVDDRVEKESIKYQDRLKGKPII